MEGSLKFFEILGPIVGASSVSVMNVLAGLNQVIRMRFIPDLVRPLDAPATRMSSSSRPYCRLASRDCAAYVAASDYIFAAPPARMIRPAKSPAGDSGGEGCQARVSLTRLDSAGRWIVTVREPRGDAVRRYGRDEGATTASTRHLQELRSFYGSSLAEPGLALSHCQSHDAESVTEVADAR